MELRVETTERDLQACLANANIPGITVHDIEEKKHTGQVPILGVGRQPSVSTTEEEQQPWQANPAATPQPPPRTGQTDITPLVIADLEARRLMGIQKYGMPLAVENGRDHEVDMWQEMLDMVVYAKCMLLKREALWQEIQAIRDYAARSGDLETKMVQHILTRLDDLLTQRPS